MVFTVCSWLTISCHCNYATYHLDLKKKYKEKVELEKGKRKI